MEAMYGQAQSSGTDSIEKRVNVVVALVHAANSMDPALPVVEALPALPPGREEPAPTMAKIDVEVAGDDGDFTPQPRRRIRSELSVAKFPGAELPATEDEWVEGIYPGLDRFEPEQPSGWGGGCGGGHLTPFA